MNTKKFNFEKTAVIIFQGMAAILFLILFIFSIRYTAVNVDIFHTEYPVLVRNSFLKIVLFFILALCTVFLVQKLYSRYFTKISMNFLCLMTCGLSFLFAFAWIFLANSFPQGDQYKVCEIALRFNQNVYWDLAKGEYASNYPQQLGLITFLRFIFKVFGYYNFRAYQIFSAFMIPLMVFAGDRIVRMISNDNTKAEITYLLFMLFCVPMYGFVPFVYGEIPSTALAITAMWLFIKCFNHFKYSTAILAGIVIGLAVQFRKNVLVMAIAIGIVLFIRLFSKQSKQTIILLASLILGICVFQQAINLLYSDKKPEDAVTYPVILHVVMGFNDDNGHPGAFNNYPIKVMGWTNYNYENAKIVGKEDFAKAINKFKAEPKYMVNFYLRKMEDQWQLPLYQCFAMNNYILKEQVPFVKAIYNRETPCILLEKYMKAYQMLCYFGMFLFVLPFKNPKNDLWVYMLAIGVFGGFLFSMLWEAKARYTFPYLMLMIPCMSVGLVTLFDRIKLPKYKGISVDSAK